VLSGASGAAENKLVAKLGLKSWPYSLLGHESRDAGHKSLIIAELAREMRSGPCGRVLVRRCGAPQGVTATARCRSLELSTFLGVENVALAPS
jgi:hypothetical protein